MMRISDKIQRTVNFMRTAKLKGHATIILEDVVTKRREVIEQDNMMTDALKNIFETNVRGLTDFYNLLPTYQTLLGGILLFEEPLTAAASNIWPQSQADNRLIGHAGSSTHTTASTTRGNPNPGASSVDPEHGTVINIWDFSLEQGNGHIEAAALTSGQGGNAGLFPTASLPLFRPTGIAIGARTYFDELDSGGTAYGRSRAMACPVAIDDDGNGLAVYLNGDSFEEIVVRHPFVCAELIEADFAVPYTNYRELSSRTATLSRTYTSGYSLIAFDADNYYIYERDSSNSSKVYLDIVNRSTFAVTSQTITISGATLARPSLTQSKVNNGIVSNRNLYMISGSDGKTFVRINIDTPADVEELTSNLSGNISLDDQPVVVSDGLIAGNNFLINGDTVYPVQPFSVTRPAMLGNMTTGTLQHGFNSLARYKNSPHFVQSPTSNDNATYNRLSWGGELFLPYMASIANLSNGVDKNNNKTMRVQYQITEDNT